MDSAHRYLEIIVQIKDQLSLSIIMIHMIILLQEVIRIYPGRKNQNKEKWEQDKVLKKQFKIKGKVLYFT